MRKKLLKIHESSLTITLILALIFNYFPSNIIVSANYQSMPQTFHIDERKLAEGVFLNQWVGKNSDGTNRSGKTITFDPLQSDATIFAAFGNSVRSRTTLSSISKIEEVRQGGSIIGGINGDFYYTDSGIPIGLLIQNGRLISYSNTKWNAVGFNVDGSVIIDMPNIEMNFIRGEEIINFRNLNKPQNDWGPYLYTSDFGADTASMVPSLEVVLDIIEGDLSIGETLKAKVIEIRKDVQSTPIGPNQLILSARNGKSGYNALAKLQIDEELIFEFKDIENKWANVYQAVGGDTILINDGVITSKLATNDFAPSTAVGVKANGEIVLYQVDGRSSNSKGVSSQETAEYLHSLGCVKALKLDGGGSSAIIARMPGYGSPGLMNNPSDGVERANSNGLLLISKRSLEIVQGIAEKSKDTDKIHIYPGFVYALPNTKVQFNVLGTDKDYLPAQAPTEVSWVTSAGEYDENGLLQVGSKPGEYSTMAVSGLMAASSTIVVLNEVTALKPSKATVTMLPGDTVDINCEAYFNGFKVNSSDSSFTWQVEGGIGTITSEGVFTLKETSSRKGRIKINYGNTEAFVNILIPSSALNSLEDFEGDIPWGTTTIRAKTGKVEIINNEDLARTGKGLLKLDYDFTLAPGESGGVAGVYAHMIDSDTNKKIETPILGSPRAIGMWVYGDNSKTWLRASVKDSAGQSFYIDFTPDYNPTNKTGGVNWTGWNYVEANIPSNRKGPFTLETPIRVMCSRDEMRTKGTLYFDQMRAIYPDGEPNLQTTASITSPQEGAILASGVVPFTAEIKKAINIPGIDMSSVKAYVDGIVVENITIEGGTMLNIKGQLGDKLPLADGYHILSLEYADLMGNKGNKTVSFSVQTGAPQVSITLDKTVYEGGTFNAAIDIKNPSKLTKIYLDVRFDPLKVTLVDQDQKTPGIQTALGDWLKNARIINHKIEEGNGRIIYEIDNLTALSKDDVARLANIKFKANKDMLDSTSIDLHVGAMIVNGNVDSQRFSMPSMNVSVVYPYTLEVEAGKNVREVSKVTVRDTDGKPVSGIGIYLNDISYAFWTTDENGQVLSTGISLLLSKGETLRLRARNGEMLSKEYIITD